MVKCILTVHSCQQVINVMDSKAIKKNTVTPLWIYYIYLNRIWFKFSIYSCSPNNLLKLSNKIQLLMCLHLQLMWNFHKYYYQSNQSHLAKITRLFRRLRQWTRASNQATEVIKETKTRNEKKILRLISYSDSKIL